VNRYVPAATVTQVLGPPTGLRDYTYVEVRVPGERSVLSGHSGALSSFPVSEDGTVPEFLPTLSEEEVSEAERVLADGGVVVFTDQGVTGTEATLAATRERGRASRLVGRATLRAVFVPTTQLEARAQGVMSPEAAAALGVTAEAVGLLVHGAEITEAQQRDVNDALLALDTDASMFVERGYQNDGSSTIIQLVLGALGAVLMLGGTLTATFLSVSDARPDLATLASVGASPRTRRAIAASYALVISVVGAVLGVGVGLIPGIGVTYPLTGADWVQDMDPSLPSHFLAIPWLLIGTLVVALPLVTALLVGLFTRSRLPLVARID